MPLREVFQMERLSIYFNPTEVFKVSSLKTPRIELADQKIIGKDSEDRRKI